MSRYEVFRDAAGMWRWRLRSGNGQIVMTSGESFASHYNALRAARNVWAHAGTAAPPADDDPQAVLGFVLGRPSRQKRGRRVRPRALS
jgi:uncharacterized protein YegP (UPF0339 family)